MDPNSGRLYTEAQFSMLEPQIQKSLVRMDGPEEQVRRISLAVHDAARRERKAAHTAARRVKSKATRAARKKARS